MTINFGDSGFSVAHAGHCDWQRPHSVQVAMSSMPFQVKSSIRPRPNNASSAGSSKIDLLVAGVHRQQRPEGVGPTGEVDVDRRHEDVEVLAVQHEHQEPEDDADVEPEADRLEPFVGCESEGSSRWATHSVKNAPPDSIERQVHLAREQADAVLGPR